jgi:hypothetical protein
MQRIFKFRDPALRSDMAVDDYMHSEGHSRQQGPPQPVETYAKYAPEDEFDRRIPLIYS